MIAVSCDVSVIFFTDLTMASVSQGCSFDPKPTSLLVRYLDARTTLDSSALTLGTTRHGARLMLLHSLGKGAPRANRSAADVRHSGRLSACRDTVNAGFAFISVAYFTPTMRTIASVRTMRPSLRVVLRSCMLLARKFVPDTSDAIWRADDRPTSRKPQQPKYPEVSLVAFRAVTGKIRQFQNRVAEDASRKPRPQTFHGIGRPLSS